MPTGIHTVERRVAKIKDDLVKLAAALNKDGDHEEAQRVQIAVVAVDEVLSNRTWPEEALWPPRLNVSQESIWRLPK